MPKVSIIMPSFNIAPYIKECLDSVIHQSLTDIEIFLVDAGSTDGTLEIEQEYARKDSRVKILEDTAHSTGYAKNLGIKLAKSKYVAIVEPDDYIAPGMMEKLYETASKYDLDIVKGNYRSFIGDGESRLFVDKAVSLNRDDYGKIINPQTDNRYFGWDMYTWTGLYKKEFLDKYNIRHNESKGAAFQDVGFWFQTFCYAERVYLLNDYFYHYRRDNPNASVNNPNRTFVMCDEYQYVKNVISKDRETWKRIIPAFYHEMFKSYFVTYERLAENLKPDFIVRFNEEIKDGFENGNIDRKLFDEYELEYLNVLLESKEKFAEKLSAQKGSVCIRQQELYKKIKGFPHCIIFSAGSHGCNLQVMLKRNFEMDVTAFCDNDVEKQGLIMNGIRVVSFRESLEQYPGAVYLIANKKHLDAIRCQLSGQGVSDGRIINCRVEELIDGFL